MQRNPLFTWLAILVHALLLHPAQAQIGDAVDNTALVWGSSPASVADWFSQSAYTHDGADAARSGAVGNTEQSDLTTNVVGPGTLTFWWKVSSQSVPSSGYYDILYFWYDDSQAMTMIYGNIDWAQVTITIPAGSHTLNWSYAKDFTGSAGLDAGFLDQVVYTPEGVDITPPGPVTALAGWPLDGGARLEWQNPPDSDLAGVRVQRGTAGHPATPAEGTTVFNAADTSCTDSGLVNGTTFYYSAFAYDGAGNFSPGTHVSVVPRIPPAFQPGDFVRNAWNAQYDSTQGNDAAFEACIDSQLHVSVVGHLSEDPGSLKSNGFIRHYSEDGTTLLWSDIYDSIIADSDDRFYGVCVDSQDNVIVTGTVSANTTGINLIVVRKYSSSGEFDWERRQEGVYWNGARQVTTDSQDNIYVAAQDFGDMALIRGQWCILKYSPDGTLQPGFPITHNQSTSSDLQDSAYDIAVDQDGNFLVVGSVGDMTTMKFDWHVRLYNASGQPRWNDTIDGGDLEDDCAYSAEVDGEGNFYVAGGLRHDGFYKWRVVKYGGAGVKAATRATPWRIWSREYPAPSGKTSFGCGLAWTPGGELLCAGHMMDEGDISQATLLRIDPVEGTLLGRQMASNAYDNQLLGIGARDDHIATAGQINIGGDYDGFLAVARLVPPLPHGWFLY